MIFCFCSAFLSSSSLLTGLKMSVMHLDQVFGGLVREYFLQESDSLDVKLVFGRGLVDGGLGGLL